MRKTFFFLVVFILNPFFPCSDSFAEEYGYRLLDHLVSNSTDIITYSGWSATVKKEEGLTVVEVVVKDVLKGRLRQKRKISVLCQDVMNPDGCKPQSPFLFLTPLSPKSAAFDRVKSFAGRFMDGQALTEGDAALLRLFITHRNTPASLTQKVRESKNPFFMTSLFALQPNPSLLSEILKTNSLRDEVAALKTVVDNLPKIRGQEEQFCQTVMRDFTGTHPNLLNEAELNLIGQLPCLKADFLLRQLASSNEFVVMLATYHLASTDAGTVKKAVQYFEEHPGQITSIEILNQLSFSIYASGVCELMEGWLKKYKALMRPVPSGISSSAERFEFMSENYARCLGHLPTSGPLLVSLLREKPLDAWPFSTPGRRVPFRILTQVVTAIERQMAKGGLSKETPDLKPALVDQLQSGHPQVVPEIMRLLKKHYPGEETDSLILRVATRPTAKKYHQSHAIMAFLEAGQKDRAIQIAQGSQYAMVRKIGEYLISRTIKPTPSELKPLLKADTTQKNQSNFQPAAKTPNFSH